MKTILKILGNIVYWTLIAVMVFVIFGVVLSKIRGPFGYRVFIVQSGSMEPYLKVGSVVLVAPKDNYKVGDVVTYLSEPNMSLKNIESTITHRIVEVSQEGGSVTYKTKGDFNDAADPKTVLSKQVLGSVLLTIPWLGYIIAFTRTELGFALLIIVPAVLIIYHEVLNIIKGIKEYSKKKNSSKESISGLQ